MGHVTLTTPLLRVICRPYAGTWSLDVTYLCTKFDHFIFSRSGDLIGAYQNLNGSRDLTTPLSGMICSVQVLKAVAEYSETVPEEPELVVECQLNCSLCDPANCGN